jgi:acyl-CoA thioester hydrolase
MNTANTTGPKTIRKNHNIKAIAIDLCTKFSSLPKGNQNHSTQKMLEPYNPEIRFADIDALGHVNNAVYLSYFEQSRIHFFRQMLDTPWDWRSIGLLVAKNEITYKLPVFLNDRIEIFVNCTAVGGKSFTLSYELKRGTDLCALGLSVMVCYNYEMKKTEMIPDVWREKLLMQLSAPTQ